MEIFLVTLAWLRAQGSGLKQDVADWHVPLSWQHALA
jgi:hypothetical protein